MNVRKQRQEFQEIDTKGAARLGKEAAHHRRSTQPALPRSRREKRGARSRAQEEGSEMVPLVCGERRHPGKEHLGWRGSLSFHQPGVTSAHGEVTAHERAPETGRDQISLPVNAFHRFSFQSVSERSAGSVFPDNTLPLQATMDLLTSNHTKESLPLYPQPREPLKQPPQVSLRATSQQRSILG